MTGSGEPSRRRRGRRETPPGRPGIAGGPTRRGQLTGSRLAEDDRDRERDWLPVAVADRQRGLARLLTLLLDRQAQLAGVLAVEGLARTGQQAVLLAVVDQHRRPGHQLEDAQRAAGKMQAAEQGEQAANGGAQDGTGVNRAQATVNGIQGSQSRSCHLSAGHSRGRSAPPGMPPLPPGKNRPDLRIAPTDVWSMMAACRKPLRPR